MEEQFILRVPPALAEVLNRVLSEDPSAAADSVLDLCFENEGREGRFFIGGKSFPASLLDLPTVVESWKTYDNNVLIKAADVGQMILVREEGEPAPEGPELRHGLTPGMRDARRRRFRREPDLNPDLVGAVEKDLQSILAGGTARDVDVEVVEQEDDGDDAELTPDILDGQLEPGGNGEEATGPEGDEEEEEEEEEEVVAPVPKKKKKAAVSRKPKAKASMKSS